MPRTFIAGMAGTLLFAAVLAPTFADARGSGSHSSGHSSSHSSSHGSTPRSTIPHSSIPRSSHPKAVAGVSRDSHGRIARSAKAKDSFKKSHPCPSTGRSSGACPGYVIDHVKPLKRGGADSPSNMQWQTKAAAKEKDKWE